MRHILTILAALLLCDAPAQAQTLKALMYNTTNGQVLYTGTNSLRFVDSVSFSSDVFGFSFEAASGSNYTQLTPDGVEFSGAAQRAATRTNLALGATWLTNTNVTNFRTAIGLGATNAVTFAQVATPDLAADSLTIEGALYFTEALTNLQVTRGNLGLPLHALTNTSNVTMMRALAGSTNTNHPFSGTFETTSGVDSFIVTVSNGIIVSVVEP